MYLYVNVNRTIATDSEEIIIASAGPVFSLCSGIAFWLGYKKSSSGARKLFFIYSAIFGIDTFLGNHKHFGKCFKIVNLAAMKKTILLTQNPYGFTTTVTKWLFILVGLSSSFNGINKLTEPSLGTWGIVLGIFISLSGLVILVLGFILFNPANKLAPKIEIDDNRISVREDIFSRTKQINWNEIKEIGYRSYALDFLFSDNKNQLVVLKTNAKTSLEIKKSIREIADRKLINIKGG